MKPTDGELEMAIIAAENHLRSLQESSRQAELTRAIETATKLDQQETAGKDGDSTPG